VDFNVGGEGFGADVGFGFGLFGEVGGGDLQAIEHQASAFWVELVGGEAGEDEAEGDLDGGTVFGRGEGELSGIPPLGRCSCPKDGAPLVGEWGAAGGSVCLVEVAEGLGVEGRGFAAAAFGEDVAALEADGFGCDFGYGVPLLWGIGKIFKTNRLYTNDGWGLMGGGRWSKGMSRGLKPGLVGGLKWPD
jgi:hypothetical protein